jgi:RHS repeat-associated protein
MLDPPLFRSSYHYFLQLGDHLGSTAITLDHGTSDLVERTTYQAFGAPESDYRNEAWEGFREAVGFTGKEEDTAIGLTYFGKRYYSAYLQRWTQPDPLEVHGPGASGDHNLYAYVSGQALKNTDPLGLCPSCERVAAEEAANFKQNVREPLEAEIKALTNDVNVKSAQAAQFEANAIAAEEAGYLEQAAQYSDALSTLKGELADAQIALNAAKQRLHDATIAHSERQAYLIQPLMLEGGVVKTAAQIDAEAALGRLAYAVQGGALAHLPSRTAAGVGARGRPVPRLYMKPSVPKSSAAAGAVRKIHMGQQGKHIVGHNNFEPGKSILRADPEALASRAGSGQQVGKIPVGQPGSKERVVFDDIIGDYVDSAGDTFPTQVGIIHYGKSGIHIVPGRPQ